VSPSVALWDEGGAVVCGFCDLVVVVCCWVGCGGLEVVYEGLYFFFFFLCG
jgi:hypothetical protein